MILSKFTLDVRSRQGRQCMSDCQAMHRSVMRLFHCTRQEGNVLYRFHAQKLAVYILSEKEPDLQDIPAGMHFSGKKDMRIWEAGLKEGQMFQFALLVAPTKKVAGDGMKNSRRRFLRSPQERLDWLSRKAELSGFSLLQVQEDGDAMIAGKHREGEGGEFYCHAVSYRGLLKVVDREKFHAAWKNGIGSGRAYGQGMLLVTRA